MARRRSRRNDGLIDLALRSDWKVSAALAVGALVVGVFVLPRLFDPASPLAALNGTFTTLAWLLVAAFGAISFVRFLAGRQNVAQATPDHGSDRLRHGNVREGVVSSGRRELPEACVAPNSSMPIDSPPPRPERWSLDVLDRIEWKRFEDLCCAFYRQKGMRAETTRLGADGGVDIRLYQDNGDPQRATAIVQCKALSKQVGVKPVRELRGVMAHEEVDKAFFMAPNGFTDDARSFAAENRITLLDGKLFLAMLERLPDDASRRLLQFATEDDWTTPTCPTCGTKMTARDSQRGPFWGCPTYPKCRGTLPMRRTTRNSEAVHEPEI